MVRPELIEFCGKLNQFLVSSGRDPIDTSRFPQMGYADMDMKYLFETVVRIGGYANMLGVEGVWIIVWKGMSNFRSTITNPTTRLREFYEKFLLDYEKHLYPGGLERDEQFWSELQAARSGPARSKPLTSQSTAPPAEVAKRKLPKRASVEPETDSKSSSHSLKGFLQLGERVQLPVVFYDSKTAKRICEMFPIKSTVKYFGKMIYFKCEDIEIRRDKSATSVLQYGDLAYWPEDPHITIGSGTTPASGGDEIRLVTKCNVFGRVVDPRFLDLVRHVGFNDKVVLSHESTAQPEKQVTVGNAGDAASRESSTSALFDALCTEAKTASLARARFPAVSHRAQGTEVCIVIAHELDREKSWWNVLCPSRLAFQGSQTARTDVLAAPQDYRPSRISARALVDICEHNKLVIQSRRSNAYVHLETDEVVDERVMKRRRCTRGCIQTDWSSDRGRIAFRKLEPHDILDMTPADTDTTTTVPQTTQLDGPRSFAAPRPSRYTVLNSPGSLHPITGSSSSQSSCGQLDSNGHTLISELVDAAGMYSTTPLTMHTDPDADVVFVGGADVRGQVLRVPRHCLPLDADDIRNRLVDGECPPTATQDGNTAAEVQKSRTELRDVHLPVYSYSPAACVGVAIGTVPTKAGILGGDSILRLVATNFPTKAAVWRVRLSTSEDPLEDCIPRDRLAEVAPEACWQLLDASFSVDLNRCPAQFRRVDILM